MGKLTDQVTGTIKVPEGKSIAANIGFDFDAQSIWIGSFNMTSPAYMAQGEFAAEVAILRILDLYDKYHIKGTFFIPGHTSDTFPDAVKEIKARGHEIAVHGYVHENPEPMKYDEERRVMEMALEALARVGVEKPVGYRSPYWDFSPNSLRILDEYGFLYDTCLMANDFYPFRPRPIEVNADKPNVFGEPYNVIELPPSWFLDDWPPFKYITGIQAGMQPVKDVYDRWSDTFLYAWENCPGGCFTLTNHPQVSGQPHIIGLQEQMMQLLLSRNAWVTTCEEIARAYVED